MIGIVQTSLLVLLSVALGKGQVLSSTISHEIIRCIMSQWLSGESCPSIQKERTKCLKEIDPVDDFAKMQLEEAIRYEEDKVKSCSNDEKRCVDRASLDCMTELLRNMFISDSDICNKTEKTASCLMKEANNLCEGYVVKHEMMLVETVKNQCSSGLWKAGPCHPRKAWECSEGVLYFTSNETSQACAKSNIDRVKTCLDNLKAKCTTQQQQLMIYDKMRVLKIFEQSCDV